MLIVFWVSAFLFSVGSMITLFYPEFVTKDTMWYILILDLMFLPAMFLMALIGGGYFKSLKTQGINETK